MVETEFRLNVIVCKTKEFVTTKKTTKKIDTSYTFYDVTTALNVSMYFLVLLTRNGAFPVKHWYTIVPMLHRSALAS